MSWQVLTTRTADPDFDALDAATRDAVSAELFAWVDEGPPLRPTRRFAGIVVYEDRLSCGYTVTYFVDESERRVAVLKLRAMR